MPSWILLHTHSVMALIIGVSQLGMFWFLMKSKDTFPVKKWIKLNYFASTLWYIDQMIRFSIYPGKEGTLLYVLETIFIYGPVLVMQMFANVQINYLFIESRYEKERKIINILLVFLSLTVLGIIAWNELFNNSNFLIFQMISFIWGIITFLLTFSVSIRKAWEFRYKNPQAQKGLLLLAFPSLCFFVLSLICLQFGLFSPIGYWTYFILVWLGEFTLIVTYIRYTNIFVSFQLKITTYSLLVVVVFLTTFTLFFLPPKMPDDIVGRLNQQEGLQNVFIIIIVSIIITSVLLPILLRRTLTQPLKQLLGAVQTVNSGNLDVEVPVLYQDEIGLLTKQFNLMTHSLQKTNQRIIEYTVTLSELFNNQQKVQEQTLNHISQEIHDNVGQMLSLVRIQLNLAAQQNSNENELISEAQENIGRAMMDLRDMAKGMSNDRIKLLGLYASVEQEADRIRRSGICEISLSCSGSVVQLDHQRETILFRVMQECLQNVLKHSEARLLEIFFQYTQDDIQIKIQDNGKGFVLEKSRAGHGLGLMNMQHRIQLMGGEFTINSEPGVGTKIYLQVPVDKK
ncbi:MAG: ATP-binding protein [Chitinophagia bacterium]